MSQPDTHLPVPIRTETVAPAIKIPDNHPGEKCEQHACKMKFPSFYKTPTNKIKCNKNSMKHKEKIIEKDKNLHANFLTG